ncbi:MAG: hypothetical protein B6A08_12970 [Sorangiineae bacterium NIC37A_2]|nr:MAG: hypothetical protein B6A08_12970 [Sorangiineae bacterium NIC37A_2]
MSERIEEASARGSPLPERYQLLRELGAGGGGRVLSALDRGTGREVALKVLKASAGPEESSALIREISALSGLEGLGFPRVLMVGQSSQGQPYLVRELVHGRTFDEVIEEAPEEALALLPAVADALTVVHRASLLHGDIKPGNVIARDDGGVALLDLGLSTQFKDGGASARGWTPRYAAPELFRGAPLTAEAEVYSLGAMLREILQRIPEDAARGLQPIADRALSALPSARYPSADEFSEALKLLLAGRTKAQPRALPAPVLGLDDTASSLKQLIVSSRPGSVIRLVGPEGSGRSTLLRRVGWELALEQPRVRFLDSELLETEAGRAIALLLLASTPGEGSVALVDGEPTESEALDGALQAATESGARVVLVADRPSSAKHARDFIVPPLEPRIVRDLVRMGLPALPEALLPEVIALTEARPRALRTLLQKSQGQALANVEDLRELWEATPGPPSNAAAEDLEATVRRELDRGRFGRLEPLLRALDEHSPSAAWLRARYELAAGSASRAVQLCDEGLSARGLSKEEQARLRVTKGRALLGINRLAEAEKELEGESAYPPDLRAEALSYRALAQSLAGNHERAEELMNQALALLDQVSPRCAAIAHSSAATLSWRRGRPDLAADAYEKAVAFACEAGDAGALASAQANLASLRKEQGAIAPSIELFEGAIDAGLRSGRTVSVQQALLNLTNLDIYLGRLERAKSNLARLDELGELTESQHAQRLGLTADLWARMGRLPEALAAYELCEEAFRRLGRSAEAAEAALESILVCLAPVTDQENALRFTPSEQELDKKLERARADLGGRETPLLRLAEARTLAHSGAEERAERRAEEALELSRSLGQREWAWRSLSLLAELLAAAGRHTRAERVRAEAIEILEEIGARLPPDLRQVYWSDPRRRGLRAAPERAHAPRFVTENKSAASSISSHLTGVDAVSRMSQTPLERRLAKILAINSDLAAETRFDLLATKIVLHATELLEAESGYLLLGTNADDLTVAASRAPQGKSHREFSRSIAAQVLSQGTPFFSVDASADQRLVKIESVHQAALAAVACVPILSPSRVPLGALYVESRARVQATFGEEIPTLLAFADQAAIALESARLVRELSEKSSALEEKNARLLEAQAALKSLLAERTERLQSVRSELKRTRDELSRGAAFAGLVGGSAAMRRVYSLIERVQKTDVPVLITGESGTGKEVVARAIHEGSRRAKAKMLAVNCGAIPESILESELFGHVRGAFTGADRDRKGLFQEARGGTLFLDEIGETPLKMQAGLLRVLQESKVRAVGSAEEVPVDVRVIFATNRELSEAVAAGKFRDDLLYRIQVVEVHLPPLRERTEDIPLLVDHFLARAAAKFGGEKRHLARDAMAALLAFHWPGNVRQLENVLTNAWILSDGAVIHAEDLNLPTVRPSAPRAPRKPAPKQRVSSEHFTERDRDERARILEALDRTGWNRARAAQVLGMPRRTFYRRLQHYGLQ